MLVVPDDQTETFVRKGEHFQAPINGVFMGDARYQRYRKAVADRIMGGSAASNSGNASGSATNQ